MEDATEGFLGRLCGDELSGTTPAVSMEHVSLCTLFEALLPLVSLVPQVEEFGQRSVTWAKSKFGDVTPHGLTCCEVAALNIYTGQEALVSDSLCFKLNTALRTTDPATIEPFLPYMKLLLTAISKLPSFAAKTNSLWKGCTGDISTQYKEGKEFFWPSFSSCVPTKESALQMIKGFETPKALIQIQFCSHVVDIHDFSEFGSEQEILVLPGRQLEVRKNSSSQEVTVIELVEKESSNIIFGVNIFGKRVCTSEDEILEEMKNDRSFVLAPQVTCVDLELREIGVPGIKLLCESLKGNNTITELSLYKNYLQDGASDVCEALKANKSLTNINLSRTFSEESDTRFICEALKVNDNLTNINLFANNIGEDGAHYLCEALKVNNTLTSIDLQFNHLGDNGIARIFDSLMVNTTLKKLNIPLNDFGDNGAGSMFESLRVNSTLTSISLENNSIGEIGAKLICEALKVNKSLTKLNLMYNNIGENGAKFVYDALKVNATLTNLNIGSNNIEDGAIWINKALKVNHTLRRLNIYDNNVRRKIQHKILATGEGRVNIII
eukprot:TRINITY_DN2247_c0_g1_i1.p1 TRINITY_DN2247_c0_g1~~TRINITY_DN2247_c0_g1_i1.p1  ORF type:complete len:553 (-),score=82.68 TRINITY_DN2247_c0_g1_i1:2-1660(-)